jgi:signal transduction histidine kinase
MMLASHQLRTPLTPIIAYADLLSKGELTAEEISTAAREILQAGLEMQRLFDRMASVALLQDADAEHGPTVPVGLVLDEIGRDHRGVLDGVEVEGDPALTVRCRPEWVAPAIGELLDNSHRFGKPPIRLSWQATDDHVEFATTDSGSGPDEGLTDDRLFGQWGAGAYDDMMPAGMRSHLGLLQARLLAALSGGDLHLRRENGSWAFVLTVPAGQSGGAGHRV